ncbi:MAG: transglutaminase-like domain-containing protein, partial [Pseudomonadales bacterium]|nr:transglutaminase-like domain-containing protein [Pseudomonadales bacterium]
SSPVQIRYQFEPTGKSLPEQFFEQQTNRYTVASQGFAEEIKALNTEGNPAKQIFDLILKAKSVFDYGHADERFNDGHAQVPALCGTTKGSCVDINTYLIAASNSLGIPVQYVAGYWFHPERNFTPDMHCWLLFNVDNTVIPWDLAHHLKWGVSELSPSLNPAGGRRVPMSFGRGLNFEGPHGTVQISHFSEPVWLLPNGQTEDSILEISIQD